MSLVDQVFKDDDAHLMRQMAQAISDLQEDTRRDTPTGAIVDFSAEARSATWSTDRVSSVGASYSRWWQMSQINEERIIREISENPLYDLSVPAAVHMGRPGLKTSEGSYALQTPGDGLNYLTSTTAGLVTGTRSWSMELIFTPMTLPMQAHLLYNGSGANGYGVYVAGAGNLGITGSTINIYQQGGTLINTAQTVAVGTHCHLIVVSENIDNTMKWYLGAFNPISRNFTYTSGSVANATPAIAPTTSLFIGFEDIKVDEVSLWNGKIVGGTALGGAEDRIRTALQPSAPTGWAACDGAAVSRNKFNRLFQVIGTKEGVGDGTTTFNLPNVPGAIVKL